MVQAAFSIARAYAEAGDDVAAEHRLRRLAGRRWITANDREAVVRLLAELLERTGRGSEARAVEAEHAAWQQRPSAQNPLVHWPGPPHAAPSASFGTQRPPLQ